MPALAYSNSAPSDPVVHADETSWREDKGKAWLWVAATPLVAVFIIAVSRGATVAKRLLGVGFSGKRGFVKPK